MAGTPAVDPSGLAMFTSGYSPQAASAATPRSQDLAQALAAMRDPAPDVRAPVAWGYDRLADALLQRRYGAQTALADQPWIVQLASSGLDQLSGSPTAGFAPTTPTPQAREPQGGTVNLDDLVPNQVAPWRPSSSGVGGVYFGQPFGDAAASQTTQPTAQFGDALTNSPFWRTGAVQYVAANTGGSLVDPRLMADILSGSDDVNAVAFGGLSPLPDTPVDSLDSAYSHGNSTALAAARQPFSFPGEPVAIGGPPAPQVIGATPASASANLVGDTFASGDWLSGSFTPNSSPDFKDAMAADLASAAGVNPFAALRNTGAWGAAPSIDSVNPVVDISGVQRALPQGSFTLPPSLEPAGMWNPPVQPILLAHGGGNGGPPWAGLGPIQSPGIPDPNNGAPGGFEPIPGQPGQDGPQVVDGIPGYNRGGLWYPDLPKLPNGKTWPAIDPTDSNTLNFLLSTLSTDKSPYARNITIYAPMSGRFRLPLLWSETPAASFGPPPEGYFPVRLVGAPQNTWLRDGTATGHALDGLKHALKAAQSGGYSKMYFNMTLRVGTNGLIDSDMRPDVLMQVKPILDVNQLRGPLPAPWYDIYESLSSNQQLQDRQFQLPQSEHIRQVNGKSYR